MERMRFLYEGLNELLIKSSDDIWSSVSKSIRELLKDKLSTLVINDDKLYVDVDVNEYFDVVSDIFHVISNIENDMLESNIFYTNQTIPDFHKFCFQVWELHKRQRNCTACELCELQWNNFEPNKGYGKLIGYGSNGCMFVAQNPSYVRYPKSITPVDDIGISGQFLKNVFVNGFSGPFYYTNLVKCSTIGNAVPSEDVIQTCVENWISHEIDIVKPELIVCVGKVAADFFGGRIGSFTKWKEYNVYSVWHPSFVKRKNNYEDYNKQLRLIR